MKKIILVLLLFTFFCPVAFAKSPVQVVYQKVNPDSGVLRYGIKRAQEKIWLKIYSINKNHKSKYYQKLTMIRLAELKYIVDNKQIEFIENGSSRYSVTAGLAAEYIINHNLNNKNTLINSLSTHIPILERMKSTYPHDTAEWRFIQQDIDSLNIYILQLSKPIS